MPASWQPAGTQLQRTVNLGKETVGTHIQDRLLPLCYAARDLMPARCHAHNRSALLSPALSLLLLLLLLLCLLQLLLLQRAAENSSHTAWGSLGRIGWRLGVRHGRKHLMLRGGARLAAVLLLHLTVVLALQGPAEAGHGPRRSTEVCRRRIAVVIRKQSAGAVDGTGYSRCHGLVDGE